MHSKKLNNFIKNCYDGVGGQFFKNSTETHQTFLDYRNKNKVDYWVTTFSEAMEYVTSK